MDRWRYASISEKLKGVAAVIERQPARQIDADVMRSASPSRAQLRIDTGKARQRYNRSPNSARRNEFETSRRQGLQGKPSIGAIDVLFRIALPPIAFDPPHRAPQATCPPRTDRCRACRVALVATSRCFSTEPARRASPIGMAGFHQLRFGGLLVILGYPVRGPVLDHRSFPGRLRQLCAGNVLCPSNRRRSRRRRRTRQARAIRGRSKRPCPSAWANLTDGQRAGDHRQRN